MKNIASFLILLLSIGVYAQNSTNSFEKYPVFPECSEASMADLENCFNNTLQQFVFTNFKMPGIVSSEKYQGEMSIFFEVDKEGQFKILYTDAVYNELKEEAKRVFALLPQVTPATYNGNPAYVQFTIPLLVPLESPTLLSTSEKNKEQQNISESKTREALTNEYDAIESFPYANEEYRSNINIPLSHHSYSRFDPALNRVGLNNHTSQKPYIYSEVNKYYDFEAENQKILKNKSSWLGRKWWNEHFISLKGKDYWLTIDPGVDLQVGKDFDAEIDTYNNTRLVYTQGGIGKSISFFAVIYESQGRFAGYYNRFAESIKPRWGESSYYPRTRHSKGV